MNRPIDHLLDSKYLWLGARCVLALLLFVFAWVQLSQFADEGAAGGRPFMADAFALLLAGSVLMASAMVLFDRGIWMVCLVIAAEVVLALLLSARPGSGVLAGSSVWSLLAIVGGLLNAVVASRFHQVLRRW
ncbi:MAG: hypothetical protein Q7P63_08075 [Verrucomicrobiota bacterium JB022]|nr:hypothetical protein [Verrucomicrobiota bacterium JB022]